MPLTFGEFLRWLFTAAVLFWRHRLVFFSMLVHSSFPQEFIVEIVICLHQYDGVHSLDVEVVGGC